MIFNQEMRRVYQGGTLGKILYAEGEYNHPGKGDKIPSPYSPFVNHWRLTLPRTYYLTHSLAPLMLATGSKPVRVSAMPIYFPPKSQERPNANMVADRASVITCLNDDNSVFRVFGNASFGAHGNSYRLCCEKGQIENVRGMGNRIMLRYNPWQVPEGHAGNNCYEPELSDDPDADWIYKAGHGGGDFFVIRKFLNCIRENEKPEMDEYFATRMASVGILAHRSQLEGGKPYDIPDFSKEEDCLKWENDTLSPFYYSDGREPTMPCCSHPEYSPSQAQIDAYEKACEEARNGK
jgi:predicted dehydrogenase